MKYLSKDPKRCHSVLMGQISQTEIPLEIICFNGLFAAIGKVLLVKIG